MRLRFSASTLLAHAALALAALCVTLGLAAPVNAAQTSDQQTCINEMTEYTIKAVAENSYLMADAMLVEREKASKT